MRGLSLGLLIASTLLLAGCGATGALSLPTPPAGAQSVAQKLQTYWPQIQSAVALGLLVDNANPATVAAATSAEAALGKQISACAAGTDPTCASTVQAAIGSFVAGLHLSTKAQLELQALEGIFPGLIPPQAAADPICWPFDPTCSMHRGVSFRPALFLTPRDWTLVE